MNHLAKENEQNLGWRVDYAAPAGEPALIAPDSMSWRIFKNPVTFGIGAMCAVILELAEPRVRSGVWDHSSIKTDPVTRSRRTRNAAWVGVYAPQSTARRVLQAVNRMHGRVEGTTPDGRSYHALDPDLLDWVAATVSYGVLSAYERFVGPLSEDDQNRFFLEQHPVFELYGVKTQLNSYKDFFAMMERLAPRFEPHEIVRDYISIVSSDRIAPGLPQNLKLAYVNAAVSILPESVRSILALEDGFQLSDEDTRQLEQMAHLAEITPDESSPAAQASVRLGLPSTFLWQSPE